MNNKMTEVLRLVAKENGVSYEEVKAQIECAIGIAIANSDRDPYAQRFWEAVPRASETRTAEELLAYMTEVKD